MNSIMQKMMQQLNCLNEQINQDITDESYEHLTLHLDDRSLLIEKIMAEPSISEQAKFNCIKEIREFDDRTKQQLISQRDESQQVLLQLNRARKFLRNTNS